MYKLIVLILSFILIFAGDFILFYYNSLFIGKAIGLAFILVGFAILIGLNVNLMRWR